jgi:hypothetical protein
MRNTGRRGRRHRSSSPNVPNVAGDDDGPLPPTLGPGDDPLSSRSGLPMQSLSSRSRHHRGQYSERRLPQAGRAADRMPRNPFSSAAAPADTVGRCHYTSAPTSPLPPSRRPSFVLSRTVVPAPRPCARRNAGRANALMSRAVAKSSRAWSAWRSVSRRSGSSASEGSVRISLSIDYPNPIVGEHRANMRGDSTTPRPIRRRDLRPERSHPSANRPNGPATGCGANRVHNRRSPARSAPRPRVRQRAL